MTSQNKFLDGTGGTDGGTGGISGGISVTDGGTDIFVNSVKIRTATPSENVKTNNQKILTTFPVEWVALDDTNPQTITSTLEADDFKTTTYPSYDTAITNIKEGGEFPKLASVAVPTPPVGTLRFYANTDDTFHQKDDSGVDKIIGNEGHVLGPNSVSTDGKVAIYNGTTGKVLKDSNLTVDGTGHLDISGNFARYQGVSFLSPTEVNSLAAVGYVQQERDSSNSRITTLETKTSRIGFIPATTTTFIEFTNFKINGEGIDYICISSPNIPMTHNIIRQIPQNASFLSGEVIYQRDSNITEGVNSINVFKEKLTAASIITPAGTNTGVDYEIDSGSGTTVTTRLKIGADNITTLTADTINMDATFLNTKAINIQSLLPGATEKIQIINFGLDQQINADGNLKIESQGDLNIQAAGIGTVSIPDLRATGTLLLQLGNRIRSVDISNNLSDLEIDAGSMTLDIPLVTQRNSATLNQNFFKLGTSPDGTLINRRKVQALDSTLATADLFVETVTASGDITNANHGADYEIKTSVDGSTVKNTRLKIAANGRTDIYGPDIFLDGNTRIAAPGFLELNFGSPTSTYTFPQNRPLQGQVLTGGIGDGALEWQNRALYSGISDSIVVANGNSPGSLVPLTGIGSLSLPENTFKVGEVYSLICAGTISNGNQLDEITIVLRETVGNVILGTVTTDVESFVSASFELEADFQIRTVLPSVTVITNFDFTFNDGIAGSFRGNRSVTASDIGSNVLSKTLILEASVDGTSLTTTIQSQLFYLKREL
jgi:hypothetical protein